MSITITRADGVAGTCLQGYITATREQLETVFGAPGYGDDGYKVFFNWAAVVTDSKGNQTLATIYDWKFDRAVGLTEEIEWNIGGSSSDAVQAVQEALWQELGLFARQTKARVAR
jgi:hypothetical protein